MIGVYYIIDIYLGKVLIGDLMTKKDYLLAVKLIRKHKTPTTLSKLDVKLLTETFVKLFSEDNSKFDEIRFRKAIENE